MHLSTTKLHLLLALVSAFTLTWWGMGTALLVLAVLGLRTWAQHADPVALSAPSSGGDRAGMTVSAGSPLHR
jgi:hypothetical protein